MILKLKDIDGNAPVSYSQFFYVTDFVVVHKLTSGLQLIITKTLNMQKIFFNKCTMYICLDLVAQLFREITGLF